MLPLFLIENFLMGRTLVSSPFAVYGGVLADSAAERAGLRAGDELISYDGRRIFEAQTVVRATAEGEAGGTTELRVRRGDEELRFLLPRGPIGIRLQPARRPPEGFL